MKKEFPYVNSLNLEELFMKLESMNVVNVFRVSKNKKMIVLNKHNTSIKNSVMNDLL